MNTLSRGVTITLGAGGSGTAEIGPGAGGPPTWEVDALLWSTSRPGVAPIPRIQIYLDSQDANGLQCQSYDGSFGSGSGALTLSRGSKLIAVWSGGQAGDTASLTVTGTMR